MFHEGSDVIFSSLITTHLLVNSLNMLREIQTLTEVLSILLVHAESFSEVNVLTYMHCTDFLPLTGRLPMVKPIDNFEAYNLWFWRHRKSGFVICIEYNVAIPINTHTYERFLSFVFLVHCQKWRRVHPQDRSPGLQLSDHYQYWHQQSWRGCDVSWNVPACSWLGFISTLSVSLSVSVSLCVSLSVSISLCLYMLLFRYIPQHISEYLGEMGST